MITIITIGKKHEEWVATGIERYQKRLRAPFDVNWMLLPHSSLEGDQARQEESGRIAAKLRADDHVLLLDETGRQRTSPQLSDNLGHCFTQSKNVVCIIGGAYGVDDELKSRADDVLSLSPLIFPHQLVRLMLCEQLYRAQQIARGSAYHHA